MPPAVSLNGSGLQSDHIIPVVRPAFVHVQDTALQRDTAAIVGQSRARHSVSMYSNGHPESVSSTGNSTFASGPQTVARSSFGGASDGIPGVGASLSDGIPPAFETTSSCAASAAALAPAAGRRYSINLTTGKHSFL